MQIERVAQIAERTAAQVEKTTRQAGILFAPLWMLLVAAAVPAVLAWCKIEAVVIAISLLLPIGALVIIGVITLAAARRGELFLFGTQKVILTAIQHGALGSREHVLSGDVRPPAKALDEVRPTLEQLPPEDDECGHEGRKH